MTEIQAAAPMRNRPTEPSLDWRRAGVTPIATAGPAATPEFRLFCLALRPPAEPDLAELRRLMAGGVAWDRIAAGARRHRTAALLLRALQGSGAPLEVIEALRRQARVAAQRSLAQTAELARLAALFARSDIRVLALKGVALSAQLYGDPALRDARDLDVLVDPDDFDAAAACLHQAGYRSVEEALSPQQKSAYRWWGKEREYVDPASGLRVELHHRLSDNPNLFPIDFATLWAEREVVRLAAVPLATLGPRHLGLYLALHGASHCWERLQWLVDFTAAMRSRSAIDTLLVSAQSANLAAAASHALLLAHDWLGLSLPPAMAAAARADKRVVRLNGILAHFYSATDWHEMPAGNSAAHFFRYSIWRRLYTYSLKGDAKYRRKQVVREFIAPADWKAIQLPDRLFWLFLFIRPFGWLMRRRRIVGRG